MIGSNARRIPYTVFRYIRSLHKLIRYADALVSV